MGDFVPASRIRRVSSAKVQQVLNPQELKVFQYLWGFPREWGGEEYRERQVGQGELIRKLELTKKSVRLILRRLADKAFIAVQTPQSESSATLYRVFCYQAAYKALERAGKLYYAHSGNGTLFVKQYSTPSIPGVSGPSHPGISGSDLPGGSGVNPPRDSESPTPGIPEPRHRGDSGPPLREMPRESFQESISEAASSSEFEEAIVGEIVRAVAPNLTIDDGLVWTALAKLAQPLKIHQAVHFAKLAAVKVAHQKNVHNPAGLWVAQFVNYASGTTLQLYEAQVQSEREQYREMGLTEQDWQATLEDPASQEDQKQLARRILNL
jgi:hypothetical protein